MGVRIFVQSLVMQLGVMWYLVDIYISDLYWFEIRDFVNLWISNPLCAWRIQMEMKQESDFFTKFILEFHHNFLNVLLSGKALAGNEKPGQSK